MIERDDYQLCGGKRERWALTATRFCKGGGAPMRDLYKETGDELRARTDFAPMVFNTEAEFDPLYATMNNQLAETALFGDAGGTVTLPTPGYAKASGDYQAAANKTNESIANSRLPSLAQYFGANRGISAVNTMKVPKPVAPTLNPTTTINRPATRGLLDLASRAGTAQRTADINDWKNLSPQAMEAIKASNPQLAKLIDSMVSNSQYELSLGGNMDPAALRMAQQTVRSRQAGMLGGTGAAGDMGEAMGISQFGQNLRQQRLQNATGAAGMSGQYYSPLISDLMNRNYNPMGAVQAGYATSGGTGRFATTINANDLFSSNQNAAATNAAARANSSASMTSAGISGAASIGSAAMLAMLL